jgi:hypothetical protein
MNGEARVFVTCDRCGERYEKNKIGVIEHTCPVGQIPDMEEIRKEVYS